MKTEYSKSILKDNVAAATVLTAIVVAVLGTLANSTDARADQVAAQQMEAIIITAPRMETVTLDTIVVTASRSLNTVVASN